MNYDLMKIRLQYQKVSLHILFINKSIPLCINALLASLNDSLKRTGYQVSRDQVEHDVSSRLLSGRLINIRGDIFWPPRSLDLSFLDLMINSFQGMIRWFQECVDAQGSTFTNE